MISKEHKKHPDIARPAYGFFSRNEWAIVGGQCHDTRRLAGDIMRSLSARYQCAYVDATHHNEKEAMALPQHLDSGATITYTDHIGYHEFHFLKEFNQFRARQLFNDADMVLINGNHFEAKKQVVIIDANKKASLEKRLAQLTNVELILLADAAGEIFDFVKSIAGYNTIPVYQLSDTQQITGFFNKKMQEATPPLNGVVLAGGKSLRMGHDKGMIKWYGKEQQYYIADLLKPVCEDVYISCRPDQQIDHNYRSLPDTFTGLGPFGAILSAFREKPDSAWMVMACDLPLIDAGTLAYLKEHRNVSSMATSFESPYNHFPEPLIAIWEPRSYPVLLSFLSQGYNCPVKALRNLNTTVLKIEDTRKLTNVNTQEELATLQQQLQKNEPRTHVS